MMADGSGVRIKEPPPVPLGVVKQLAATPIRYLGGRVNERWLVERAGTKCVLRSYRIEDIEAAPYEHEVLRRLRDLGLPVGELVDEPIHEPERTWGLFRWLPGESIMEKEPKDRRLRGRLLAELHDATCSLIGLGQRNGFLIADKLVASPELLNAVRIYEGIRPDVAHAMRWHLDKARELFSHITCNDVIETIVIHSDFAPWNTLFQDGKLTGIVDFESTHLNYRVSDFALAWRGHQDEVIEGYEEVRPLSDRDRQLLIPAYWSWLFLGVKEEINAIVRGKTANHGFDWQIRHFLGRSSFHAGIAPYRGRNGRL
jgi:Ser/Thr protein kinase RdoA (MazF antagonist)